MIGLCTDSNSQLPRELAARFGIEVVPLTVTIDGTDYLEGVDLDADAFYARLAATGGSGRDARAGRPDVATSQPSPGRFAEAYDRLAELGSDEIVSIHVRESLSGTVGSASLAAAEARVPVHVVDSGTASFGVSCCVWAAALAAREGATADQVVAAARALTPRIGTAFVIGVPRLTEAGGRAPEIDLHGDDIPVLAMSGGGELRVLARVATLGAAVVAMTDYALSHAARVNVALGTSDSSSRPVVAALQAALEAADSVDDLVHYRIGPSIGAHTGPGTAGLFVFPAA